MGDFSSEPRGSEKSSLSTQETQKGKARRSSRSSLNPLSSFSEVRREDILRHVFGDVGDLLDDFSCAVESTVLLHGRMYVTTRFLCFYSNLFGLEKKICIPYTHVTAVAKENTALVIPNAIAITTIRKEYVFRSFWDRDECFRMLKEHIRGMAHKGGGVHERSTSVQGYSMKKNDSSKSDAFAVSTSFDEDKSSEGRGRTRSDMSRPSDIDVDFTPSQPGTPGSSTP